VCMTFNFTHCDVCLCVTVDVACNFESLLCGWSSDGELMHSHGTELADLRWRQSSSEVSDGPVADHSSTDQSQL